MNSVFFVILLLGVQYRGAIVERKAYSAARKLKYRNSVLKREEARSEVLLLNILPKHIAEQLQDSTGTIANSYDLVSRTKYQRDVCLIFPGELHVCQANRR